MKKVIIYSSIAIALLATAVFCGYRWGCKTTKAETSVRVDTTYIRDTLVKVEPVEVVTRVVDSLVVPCYVPEYVHDTVFVRLPIEQKVYEDSTYRAVVSGYRPRLDTISVFPMTTYITTSSTVMQPKKWTLGLTLGPSVGIGFDGQPMAGVTLTFGLQRAIVLK